MSAASAPEFGVPEFSALEFIGMIQPRPQSEIHPADRSIVLDKAYLKDFAQAHEASLLTSKAKVFVDEVTVRSAGLLLDGGGASATKQSYNLDRHWRNARTLASHNPGTYRARAIGDHAINGTPLPVNGFF